MSFDVSTYNYSDNNDADRILIALNHLVESLQACERYDQIARLTSAAATRAYWLGIQKDLVILAENAETRPRVRYATGKIKDLFGYLRLGHSDGSIDAYRYITSVDPATRVEEHAGFGSWMIV